MKKTKLKAQVKSRFYYVFWALLHSSVWALYVGTGYRVLHSDMRELLSKVDGVLLHKTEQRNGFY